METDCKINLTDLQLRNLAEHIPPEKASDLGLSLGLTKTDLSSILRTNDPVGNTFRILVCWRTNLDPMLIQWRNQATGKQTERLKLQTALTEHNLEKFISCIDAHVTVEENNSETSSPTANLALPNPSHQADRKQEIDILTSIQSSDDTRVSSLHTQIHHLITHPADSDASWSHIRQLKSVFEPHARLTNILMLPMRFTVDVVSLNDLMNLKRSIDNGRLTEDLLPVLLNHGTAEGDVQADPKNFVLRLELDKASFSSGVQFFNDLNPSASNGQSNSSSVTEDFDAWTTRKPKNDIQLPDNQTERGVNLVWRNVSQQSFGF